MTDKLDEIQERINILAKEHQELEEMLEMLHATNVVYFTDVQTLKRRKLHIKDQILHLTRQINPDIIA
jgi:hypothetical protein